MGLGGMLTDFISNFTNGGNQGNQQPVQLPAYDNHGRLDSFYQSPFYQSMPEYAYMPAGMKQDNKDDEDDLRYAQMASQQAANMRSWNNYMDRVHMEYLNSMVPNYETQSYEYKPTDELLTAYSAKPELKKINGLW
jgi:hypothetical protein